MGRDLLLTRPRRFHELRRSIDGITQRSLTQVLRRLERNGVVSRRVLAGRPIGVEYSLTELGSSLREPLLALYEWTVGNTDAIALAQRSFDEQSPPPTAASGRLADELPGAETTTSHGRR